MNVIEILTQLNQLNISLFEEGNQLKVKAPAGVMNKALFEEIKQNKEELLKLIVQRSVLTDRLAKAPEQADYPLSRQQQSIWVISQDPKGNLAYNMPLVLKLGEQIQIELIESACKAIVKKHAALRTSFFQNEKKEIRQQITTNEPKVAKIDCTSITEDYLDQTIREEGMKAFDLETAPLIRFTVLQPEQGAAYLLITVHHMVCDGISLQILQQDLLDTYTALSIGGDAVPTILEYQYPDYVAWKKEEGHNERWSSQLAYWKNQLAGEWQPIQLSDNKRAPIKTFNGKHENFGLADGIHDKLKAICQEERVTTFTGLTAILNVLINKYSNEEDIVIGTVVAGRSRPEFEPLVGLFINSLPLRTKLDTASSFRAQLATQKKVIDAAMQNQEVPFEEIAGQFGQKRDFSRSPVFDWLMVFNDWTSDTVNAAVSTQIEWIKKDLRATSQYDAVLSFNLNQDGKLSLGIEYNSDNYTADFIQTFVKHFNQLAEALIARPDQAIQTVNFISTEEKQLILEDFNQTFIDYTKNEIPLIHLFKEQVRNNPDKVMLKFGDMAFTFKELDKNSDQLAHFLAEQFDCSLEAIIGVALPKSEWMLISILAVLKTGGAYLPIDPTYPQERKDYMQQDSGMVGCIDDRFLDQFLQNADRFTETYPIPAALNKQHLAYVIYTSGSTGNPKGCMLENEGVVNRIEWMWREYGYDTSDVILQKTTFTFDVSVWEIFMPLCWGCQMALCEDQDTKFPERITQLIHQHKVTCLHFVPSMLDAYIRDQFSDGNDLEQLASLKRVITSGEALKAVTVRNWYQKVDVPIFNLYGPTEASIDVSAFDTRLNFDGDVPIGKPVANTWIYLLDDSGNLVPPGVNGEIYLGGIQLARGYLNNASLTEERFIADPFNENQRLYKSGDIGRWLPDGNIVYLKRRDHQVKIRGFRIELGEIEHAINEVEAVSASLAHVWTDQQGNKQLIAYVIGAEAIDFALVKNELTLKLPEYMVPVYFMQVLDFPVKSNGKVDRKKLPAPSFDDLLQEETFESPQNDAERRVAAVFKDMFGLPKVSRNTNFFDAGGDSISVIELAAQLKQTFKQAVAIADLYQHSTVQDIAAFLDANQNGISVPDQSGAMLRQWDQLTEAIRITHPQGENIEAVYPMSPIQKGMIFGSMASPTQGVYHDQFVYPLHFPQFDADRFRLALKLLVRKHEIFRTAFDFVTLQQELQVVFSDIAYEVPFRDLSKLDAVQQQLVIEDYLKEERQKPFDFNQAPLWRIHLFQCGASEIYYVLQFHHSILDGWSIASFNKELYELYATLESSPDYQPDRLKCTHKDAMLAYTLEKESFSALEFWKEYLADFKRLDFFDQQVAHEVLDVDYDRDFLNRLDGLAKQQGISIKTLVFAALSGALQLMNQEDELTIGLLSNNRPVIEDGNQLIGCFLNTLPVRIQFPAQPQTWSSFLQMIEENLQGIKPHERATLYDIKNTFGDQTKHGNPFFDVLFNYINFRQYDQMDLPQTDQQAKVESHELTNSALVLDVNTTGGRMSLTYTLARPLKFGLKIQDIHYYLDQILHSFIHKIEEPISETDLLQPAHKKQILEEYSGIGNTADFPITTILELFAKQVAANPKQIALATESESLTYAEWNQRSDIFAAYLLEQGIGQGDIVPICMDRSINLLVGLIGIMKSGAAYLPIETKYPIARIKNLIQQSNSRLVVSQSQLNDLDWGSVKDQILWIDQFDFDNHKVSPKLAQVVVSKEDQAYLMFTSGSTGTPKGIGICHEALNNYINYAAATYLKGTGGKGMGLYSSISFDLTVTTLFGPMAEGKTLYIFSPEMELDQVFQSYFAEESGLEVIKLTPSHIDLLASLNIKSSRISKVVVGGEQLHKRQVATLKSLNEDLVIYNEYGPTEATVGCIVAEITSEEDPIHIGRPIPNTSAYVCNPRMGLVPKGIPGELFLGGIQLTKGYFNNPEETNKRFLDNPHHSEGEALYRTGDLVKWLPDGNMEYIGRADNQIKIRGHRIEPGEVEKVFNQLEPVDKAVVTVYQQGDYKALVGYYTTANGVWSKNEIRYQLKNRLPDYMVPGYLVQLEEFPLTINGKIDRKKLPLSFLAERNKNVEYEVPTNEKEWALAAAFQKVLNLGKVGTNLNFFDLGGDSIKAILLVNQLRIKGFELKVSDILQYPSIKELESKINKLDNAIDQVEIAGPVALTPIQEWFFGHHFDAHHFNQSVMLSIDEKPDQQYLERCMEALVTHHDALRMRFQKVEEGWIQRNERVGGQHFDVEYFDLTKEKDVEDKLDELATSVQQAINMHTGPLLKLACFELEKESRILLVAHHLVVDGISWRILIEDFITTYQQFKQNALNLPPKTHAYQKWSEALQQYAYQDKVEKELAFWQDLEDRARDLNNNLLGYPVEKRLVQDEVNVRFTLSKKLTQALQTKAHRAFNTDTNDVLLTALAQAFHTTFDTTQLMIWMEGHGREMINNDLDISRTVGWFTSIYPLGLPDLSDQHGLDDLVAIKETLRAIPNKGVNYGVLRYLNQKTNLQGVEALASFNFLGDFDANTFNDPAQGFQLVSSYRGNDIGGLHHRETPFSVTGMIVGGALEMVITYDQYEFDGPIVQKLADAYKKKLSLLINQLAQTLQVQLTPSDLSYKMLSVAELNAVQQDGAVEDIYGLSPLQEGMYYHWMLNNQEAVYIEQSSYRVAGALQEKYLQESYTYLTNRHPIFRTKFSHEYGKIPLQIVEEIVRPDFSFSNIEKEADLTQIIKLRKEEDRDQRFDLNTRPPIKLTVLQTGATTYEFIWTYHHILMDGWCAGVLNNEFNQIYQAISKGEKPQLPKLNKYSTYIDWLSQLDREQSLSFWKNELSGYSSPATVPFKKPLGEHSSYRKGEYKFQLASEEVQALRAQCKTLGLTEHTLLQGAWAYLLSRYNQTSDVVFGNVVSGRPAELPGVESVIGLFINMIPARFNVEMTDTVGSLLRNIQQSYIKGLPHHYSRLSEIQVQNSLRNDLFDHGFVYLNYPRGSYGQNQQVDAPDSGSMELLSFDINSQPNYDFNIVVSPTSEGITVDFWYNSNRFEAVDVERMAAHYQKMVAAFVTSFESPLNTLSYLTDRERDELLQFNYATQRAFPDQLTVIDWFKQRVAEQPQLDALVEGNLKLSYQELDERSDQLAHFFLQNGLEEGAIVPIVLHRSIDLVVSMLGVQKAGGIYVPVDPEYPRARINYLLEDTQAAWCLTRSEYTDLFESDKAQLVLLDSAWSAMEGNSGRTGALSAPKNSEAPLYIIYTSGSTGKPKGVKVSHRSIVNLVDWHIERYEAIPGSRSTAMAGVGFDAAALETWSALLSGSTLHIIDNAMRLDQAELIRYYQLHQITHAFVPPALIPGLISLDQPEGLALKYILIGGDRLPGLDTDHLTYQLVNQYGPTEAAVMVTDYIVPQRKKSAVAPPIGKPIANTHLYVLDDQMQLVPKGLPGELYIGGVPLAISYHNKPEETALRFVENTIDPDASPRLYRTGDIVRWSNGGNLEYIGRADKQVKIRGHRIEIGEIEQAFHTIGAISNVVVTVHQEGNHHALAGYFQSPEEVAIPKLRRQLEDLLPNYMLPSYLIQLVSFPLTENGKIDHHRLPAPTTSVGTQQETYEAPRNPEETALVAIFQEVLKRDSVGINDNFFELGGDSIKAILVINRLRQKQYAVETEKVLKNPVIRELAVFLKPLNPSVSEELPKGRLPLSPIQHWFFEHIPQRDHFNQSVLLSNSDRVDETILKNSLATLVQGHDSLRLRFREEDSHWVQFYVPEEAEHFVVQTYDLQQTDQWETPYREACDMLQASFDLEEGPLLKVALFRLPEEDRVLLIMHHLIVDGVSWRTFLDDFVRIYKLNINDQQVSPIRKSTSYQKWTNKQVELAKSAYVQNDLAYWQQLEAEINNGSHYVADQEADRSLPFHQEYSFELDAQRTQKLITRANQAFGTEVNDLLLSGLGLAYRAVFGGNRLTVELEGHGRQALTDEMEIGRTVGWFTSIYPVLLPKVEDDALIPYIIRVKENLRETPNKGITYNMLRYLDPASGLKGTSSLATFNYLGELDIPASVEEADQNFRFVESYKGTEVGEENGQLTPLTVVAYIVNGSLKVTIGYSDQEFSETAIEQLASNYDTLLREIIELLAGRPVSTLTPSDLTYSQLFQADIEAMSGRGELQDVYAMSPLQEGIYYHWLMNKNSAVYINQTTYTINAQLDADLILASYHQLLQNHSVLKSWFTHEYGEEHLQVVLKHVGPDFTFTDARAEKDLSTYLEQCTIADREKGFDLNQPSPMRLSVIQTEDQQYKFIWTHHHILMDGWCASLLLNEFYQIYQDLSRGKAPIAQPKPEYVNYINWLGNIDREASLNYWRNYLADYELSAVIPFMNEEPVQDGYDSKLMSLLIEGEEWADFKQICQEQRITESHFIQACWAFLLGAYNHSDDVVFGSVVSGRPGALAGVEEMIGLFINTVPVRIRCDSELTIQELVQQAKAQAVDSAAHHYLKLSDVQSQANGTDSLFDHIMVFDNYFIQDQSLVAQSDDPATMEIGSIDTTVEENYDFVMVVMPRADHLQINFKYNGIKLKERAVTLIKDHFYQLFKAFTKTMLTAPSTTLDRLDYLTLKEKETILYDFNQPVVPQAMDQTVVEMFEQQALENPGNICVTFEEQALTYAQVDELSDKWANFLDDHLAETTMLVPVCMNRSTELIVVVLGILKTGRAFVPIDTAYPEERIEYILQHIEAPLCITDEALKNGKLAKLSNMFSMLAFTYPVIENIPSIKLERGPLLDELAYIIYTSGSTGKPKGVAISHGSLANYLDWVLNAYLSESPQKMGLFSPLTFDFTITILFGPLVCGGLLHVYPSDQEIEDILKHYLAKENGFTTIKLTPAHVQLIEALDVGKTGIRKAVLGGEQLHPKQVEVLLSLNPDMEIFNEYGPTETTVGVSVAKIAGSTPDFVHIGRPITNTTIYILDHRRQLAPIGVKGELFIGGAQLADGYVKNKALTDAAFIENPFQSGEKLYRTGDLGMWLEDGNILYLGRKDSQIKIRGYRIELGEIERVLMNFEDVDHAYVRVEVNDKKDPYLVAYVASQNQPEVQTLQDRLQEILPAYMIPAIFILLEEFPLTLNGKIDKKALSNIEASAVSKQAPETALQMELCQIWESTLALDETPGINESFFELGGHSINAIKMLSLIHKTYGIVIGVDKMFKLTTIKQLANYIENARWYQSQPQANSGELEEIEI